MKYEQKVATQTVTHTENIGCRLITEVKLRCVRSLLKWEFLLEIQGIRNIKAGIPDRKSHFGIAV